ncbi:hypothetical protein JM16_008860 [Phytophthora kernoviae]|uniref:Uncharacterized protein n=1 Tax=Phytophthora kernoviae TaxID=325452 RepID=A0A8T0LMI2_9STRA|nr:hypothetical protein JM16_008860 [Phytophthora kernoviae]
MAMNVAASPIPTPKFTPDATSYVSTTLWDERPAKYTRNVLKHVCVFLIILAICEGVAAYAISQSLKNFFQKLGWSNKGSTSMKLTYDSVSQFMCVAAGYVSDERLGKFKTLISMASFELIGLLLVVIASLPSVLSHLQVSKIIFNIGLFLSVAVSQVCLQALVISYGGDQFSPSAPTSEKALYFSGQYWGANFGAFIGYLVFPWVSIHGIGAIPEEYGYFTVYLIGFTVVLAFALVLWTTRKRYVNVPPTKESIAVVILIVVGHAKNNFRAKMVALGAILYITAFLFNILASVISDHGNVGQNISYASGCLIVLATVIWVYFGRDSSFMESAKETMGGSLNPKFVDDVRQVIRILPLNAFNVFWWVCQNQRGNNQSIVQQTDARLGSGTFASQIPGPMVQLFNPVAALFFIPVLEKVVYPVYEKHFGKPPSPYGKILAGYSVAVMAMFWTGVYEMIRRSTTPLMYVDSNGDTQYLLNDDGGQIMNDIPWWTTIPQYLLVSLAGVLITIPSYDLNYSQVPQNMRSSSIALAFFVNSMGSSLLSIIVLLFGKYIPANLNDGHIEYMFFTLGALMIVNIFFYVVVMNQMQFAHCVCIFIFILTMFEELAGYGVNQTLKNFFQELGWSNKGSNSMKLTYDSLSQFACIIAAFVADEYLGKFKMLLTGSSLASIGFVLVMIAALPSVLDNVMLSKVLFCIGVFLGIALNQVGIRALLVSFGGDQFSPESPPEKRASFFSINLWASNLGIALNYAIFPSLTIYGIGAIPADYGYVAVYAIGLVLVLAIIVVLLSTRSRYVNVPPTKSALGSVIRVVLERAKHNFHAKMIVLGTALYLAAFVLNILAAFLSDDGEVGHNISYVCGVFIVAATILWIYFAQDPSFVDGATGADGVELDLEVVKGIKQVILILPFNAFNTFWWVCQNQRGNNQTIIQQTDLRIGSSPDATQIPGPTVQFFNPGSGLLLVPLFDQVIYPLYEKYAGKPPSRYGKVVAGYVIAIIAMAWTGVFEIIRRYSSLLTYVDANGETQYILNNVGKEPMSDIPWWTAIPQYVLVATATVLIQIPTYNIGYTEVPMSLRGVSIALGLFINSMGSTLLSVIVLLFGKYIPANLNDGHFEYLYFAIAALMAVNTIFFVLVMKKMQFAMIPRRGEKSIDKELTTPKHPIERSHGAGIEREI